MTRQRKRPIANTSRRSMASARRAKPGVARGRRAAAAKTKRAAPATKTKRATSRKRVTVAQTTAERRAAELFEQQAHDVWNRFGEACQQFAEGFNSEIGANHLLVDVGSATIVAKLAMGGELTVQLDREHRHVSCFITSQCGDPGSICVVDQPPIGLMADGDRLRWVFGVDPMSEDDLAVKLMTDLVQADTTPTSAASR